VLDIHGRPIYSFYHADFLIDKTVISAYKAAFTMKRSKKSDELSVAVDEIDASGYHRTCAKPADWVAGSLREWNSGDCGFEGDIGIQLDFFKTGKAILARGHIAAMLRLRCVRCLEEFPRPLAATFHYNLLPKEEEGAPQEMEIPRDEFDAYYYSGAVIDLAPLVLEQIVLHVPPYPLCRESCRGICQQCGADMNRAPCDCAHPDGAGGRFGALKHFSPKQKP
jgi:uncharacterized protein